jgi:hypothetical protein
MKKYKVVCDAVEESMFVQNIMVENEMRISFYHIQLVYDWIDWENIYISTVCLIQEIKR